MQNCFPMLPNPTELQDAEESKRPEESASAAPAAAGPHSSSSGDSQSISAKAVLELYTHLCHSKTKSQSHAGQHEGSLGSAFDSHDSCVSVVDGPEGETVMKTILHKEAVKAILNGAAVFFPDKLNRRDKLFHMMVSFTVFPS